MIVLWRITEACNYRCGFCAYDRGRRGSRKAAPTEEVERFGRLLGRWSATCGEPVMLSWLGGEPMLWPPLLHLSRTLASEAGLAISATTNGSTLHRPQVQDAILAHFAELTVSIDGFAARHDALRGSPGSWDRAAAGVQGLAAARTARGLPLRLRANIVLMRGSIGSFADLCRTMAAWGIDEITFNQLGGRDRPEFFAPNRLLAGEVERLRRLLPALVAELAGRGVRLCAQPEYLSRIAASTRDEALSVHDCAPGERFLFIDEDGAVAPCSFTTREYGVPTSEIRNLTDLAGLPQRFRAARSGRRSRDCDDCPSTQTFGKFAA